MVGNRLFIRLDLSNGIGPGKIALLEAIRAEGSILAGLSSGIP
jgi:molybdenum-dependent DNA-binding transcriptional regulator ModE